MWWLLKQWRENIPKEIDSVHQHYYSLEMNWFMWQNHWTASHVYLAKDNFFGLQCKPPLTQAFWTNFSRQTQLSYCLYIYNGVMSFSGMQRLSGSQLWRCVRKFKNYRSPRAVYFCMSTCGASCLPPPPPQRWSTCYTTLLIGTRPNKTEQWTTIWVPFLYLYF
jgi:hypothetical protein